jgi:NADPH-dependent glutamate synthase beta subunit-like oxidoreductase
MKSFYHINARTIDECIKLLKDYKGKARMIAGGTDLLGVLEDRILPDYPEAIINIKTISSLNDIQEDAEGLKMGVLVKLADIVKSSIVRTRYKMLAEAAESVATPQIRRMGTIGGNLCQDLRCWYYRYPHHVGGRISCYLKGGKSCYAITGENQYHSIFGGLRVASPPCSVACPGTVDTPSYLNQIREGNLREAAKILLDTNPFPSITGRVCPRFCEQECNRDEFDESVSIRDIERFMGDYILENANKIIKPPEADTGKRVAIVGSGPAGLSAAYYLRVSGHRVTVFDRKEEPGGMLAYGIPAYRLSKDVVRHVVKTIQNAGIEFKLNTHIGKDITLEDLKKEFDSVILASGAWSQASIGVEGEELTKSGLEFLIRVNRGVKEVTGERVLVIGGGNVAIDTARTALRLGSKEVSIIYRRSREEMPAHKEEVDAAREEGVNFYFLSAPLRIIGMNGKVVGMECVRTALGEPDESGRRRPVSIKDSEFMLDADTIISAVGEGPDLSFLDTMKVNITSGRTIDVDPHVFSTNMNGIFACGDVTTGPATVIEAIAAGRRVAIGVDLHLKGEAQAEDKDEKAVKPFLKFNREYLKKISRAKMPRLPIHERGINVEDALGLGLREIETEANRCLNCSCVAVNPSEIAVVLVALGAKIKIAGPMGFKTIPIENFFGSLRNILETDEMVTEIQVPKPPDSAKQTLFKFRLRNAVDFPIVSVASMITIGDGICKDARIVLGAVAPRPIRATEAEQTIKGKAIDAKTAEVAAELAVTGAVPLNMNAYKVKITKTLIKRAILSSFAHSETGVAN